MKRQNRATNTNSDLNRRREINYILKNCNILIKSLEKEWRELYEKINVYNDGIFASNGDK